MLERFKKVVLFLGESKKCRHHQVLSYFEEILLEDHPLHPNCCDNCRVTTYTADLKKEAELVVSVIEKLGGSPLISLVVDVLRSKVQCNLHKIINKQTTQTNGS